MLPIERNCLIEIMWQISSNLATRKNRKGWRLISFGLIIYDWWLLIVWTRYYDVQSFSYLLTFSPSDLWPFPFPLSSFLIPLFSFLFPSVLCLAPWSPDTRLPTPDSWPLPPVIPDLFQKGREIFKLRCYANFFALRADQSFKEQEIQYYEPKENNRLFRRPGYNFRVERVR